MLIFPAIDIMEGQAVRLLRGDYEKKTVFHNDPVQVALRFQEQGASYLHVVDLEGAKNGGTPNLHVIRSIVSGTDLSAQVGGGIRSMETVKSYLDSGVSRIILGTAAVTDQEFLRRAVGEYGEKIAVGVDLREGYVAIKGWTEKSRFTCDAFFENMQALGVQTVICTDISKDGAMQGTNLVLYEKLSQTYRGNLIASGGVSSLQDIAALRRMEPYGAITGKAYYTGATHLRQAIEVVA